MRSAHHRQTLGNGTWKPDLAKAGSFIQEHKGLDHDRTLFLMMLLMCQFGPRFSQQ